MDDGARSEESLAAFKNPSAVVMRLGGHDLTYSIFARKNHLGFVWYEGDRRGQQCRKKSKINLISERG